MCFGFFFCCCCCCKKSFDDFAEEYELQEYDDQLFAFINDSYKTQLTTFFPYQNIKDFVGSQHKRTLGNHEYSLFENEGFYYLSKLGIPGEIKRKVLTKAPLNIGWKLHFSINHETDNLNKAWLILQFVAAEFGLTYLKMAIPEKLSLAPQGKEFCLYQFKNPEITPKTWYEILVVIEYLFRKHGIEPNEPPLADKVITNSRYIYRRNDKSHTNQYLSAKDALEAAETSGVDAYNVKGEKDIFGDIDVLKVDELQFAHAYNARLN